MIDPAKRYRDAGAPEGLATALAKSEQELIERFGQSHEELHGRVTLLEQARHIIATIERWHRDKTVLVDESGDRWTVIEDTIVGGPRVTLHRVDAEVTWEGAPSDVVKLFREAT